MEPDSDVADAVTKAIYALWLVISPGLCIAFLLKRQRGSVIFHRIHVQLEKQRDRILLRDESRKLSTDPFAIVGACLSVVAPVGWLVAETANIKSSSDREKFDKKRHKDSFC